jgi:hypothetical protein
MAFSTFTSIEFAVRYGQSPDTPQLVASYLALGEQCIAAKRKAATCITSYKREILTRIFFTLLDTICDTRIPHHWRHHCLNQIYKPLHALESISTTETQRAEIRQLRYELNTLGTYFL